MTPPSPIPLHQIETEDADLIYDVSFDYYGRSVATCAGDCSIRIYSLTDDPNETNAVVVLNEMHSKGPIWRVRWAHPKFGRLLSSCGFDGQIHIYRMNASNLYEVIFTHQMENSVVGISWAPHAMGVLVLAAAAADGRVMVIRKTELDWQVSSFVGCVVGGVNCVDWVEPNTTAKLITGSCDGEVKIWQSSNLQDWAQVPMQMTFDQGGASSYQQPHSDWVRDVAWRPLSNSFASCSEDGSVYIWTQLEENGVWHVELLNQFQKPVYRLSWSINGNVLSVGVGEAEVSVWKHEEVQEEQGDQQQPQLKTFAKKWIQVKQVTERGVTNTPGRMF